MEVPREQIKLCSFKYRAGVSDKIHRTPVKIGVLDLILLRAQHPRAPLRSKGIWVFSLRIPSFCMQANLHVSCKRAGPVGGLDGSAVEAVLFPQGFGLPKGRARGTQQALRHSLSEQGYSFLDNCAENILAILLVSCSGRSAEVSFGLSRFCLRYGIPPAVAPLPA